MGIQGGRLALMVRENRLRGSCRVPESIVEVISALEDHGGGSPQLEEAMRRLSLRLDRVTGLPVPRIVGLRD